MTDAKPLVVSSVCWLGHSSSPAAFRGWGHPRDRLPLQGPAGVWLS